jgi:hypothetical protein
VVLGWCGNELCCPPAAWPQRAASSKDSILSHDSGVLLSLASRVHSLRVLKCSRPWNLWSSRLQSAVDEDRNCQCQRHAARVGDWLVDSKCLPVEILFYSVSHKKNPRV